jgi:hypothetical protein
MRHTKRRLQRLIALTVLLLLGGTSLAWAGRPDQTMTVKKRLDELAAALRGTDEPTKQIEYRREIYALGKVGHRFLVDGVVDPAWHRKIVTASDGDSFHMVFSGLRYRFVDERDGRERTLGDISSLLHRRLLDDADYLDRFIKS